MILLLFALSPVHSLCTANDISNWIRTSDIGIIAVNNYSPPFYQLSKANEKPVKISIIHLKFSIYFILCIYCICNSLYILFPFLHVVITCNNGTSVLGGAEARGSGPIIITEFKYDPYCFNFKMLVCFLL